jgi:glycosyltransferase involved in cell wall biosynthesis
MARLLLVGRGGNAIEARTRQRCLQLEIADKVIFAGERSDVPRLLKAADLLLFPSLWEGLPGAILEACAAGTQTLASDLPGIREIKRIVPDMVTCLPVGVCNIDWATTAINICANHFTDEQKKIIHKAILNSDFDIKRSIEKLSKEWKSNIQNTSAG